MAATCRLCCNMSAVLQHVGCAVQARAVQNADDLAAEKDLIQVAADSLRHELVDVRQQLAEQQVIHPCSPQVHMNRTYIYASALMLQHCHRELHHAIEFIFALPLWVCMIVHGMIA